VAETKMIYSKSVGYALRALTRLAEQPDGERLTSDEIAEMEHLPAPYLAKTLQELARRGLLYSEKGRAGGFTLRYRAKDIRVLEVIEALDGEAATSRCLRVVLSSELVAEGPSQNIAYSGALSLPISWGRVSEDVR
jgi:Rrf2 family protein